MTQRLKLWGPLFTLAFSLLAAGCGDKEKDISGVTVKGQLLMNGQPVKPLQDEDIQITFVQGTGESQIASAAEFNPADSTFVVKGPTGKGIPPGDYRVGVRSEIYGAATEGDEEPNRFAAFDSETTPLVAQVGSEEGQNFIIDLQQQTVTKK